MKSHKSLYKKSVDGFDIRLIETSIKKNKWRDWYIIKDCDVLEIVRYIQEGHNCIILGPPRTQKSFFLNAVKRKIEENGNEACIGLDLRYINSYVEESFYKNITELFCSQLTILNKNTPLFLTNKVIDEISFQDILCNYIESLNKKLVIFIDHLKNVHITPQTILLELLDTLKIKLKEKIVFVSANVFSTASLVLGSGSPFQSFKTKNMKKLSQSAIDILFDSISEWERIKISSRARKYCIEKTSGDRYLICKICEASLSRNRVLGALYQNPLTPDIKRSAIIRFH